MTKIPCLLIILLMLAATSNVHGVCILSFPEASKGEVFTGANLTDIKRSECNPPFSWSETSQNNPYFQLTSSSIIMKKSTRFELENDTKVGHGKCTGTELKKNVPESSFKCSGQTKLCIINIMSVDNFPPFFCDANCSRVDDDPIIVNVSEMHPVGQKNPFYRGNRCDEDYESSSTNTFSISDKSGLIGSIQREILQFDLYLTNKLDYETAQEYSIDMRITSKEHGSINKTLKIHVEDADDLSPVFDKKIYTCEIDEGHYGPAKWTVCAVKAYDPDFGINETLKYQLLSYIPEDPSVNFSISEDDGRISINGTLDRESIAVYTLSVMTYQVNRKSDRNNLATVIVHVKDIDDNLPEFDHDTDDIRIMENTENDVVIYTPIVNDRDQGKNARYEFYQNDTSVFKINQTTGYISVKKSSLLDRETHPEPFVIQLTVRSTSKITLTGTMILRVTLLDVNDNSPQFTNNSHYIYTIQRNYSVGKEIFSVNASDADLGQNGEVTYSLTSQSIPFDINKTTGAIRLKTSLRETDIRHYEFDVKATDNPVETSMIRSSWARVSIEIIDVNTHKPKFGVVWKNGNIVENGDEHTIVAILNCTDLDWSDALHVSITGGSNGKFTVSNIDENLYKLETTQTLDREDRSSYTIQMTCSDGSHNQLLDISVDVVDQNDNPPQFIDKSPVELNVTENQSSQTKFDVTDLDSGKNKEVVFSIVPNLGIGDNITIDNTTGMLTIHPLDRESLTSDTFDVTIVAADLGSPSLTSTLNVKVTVIDVNDNPPVFIHSCPRDVYVKEEEIITDNTFEASDVDKGQNKEIEYRLEHSFGPLVTVNQNGSITFDFRRYDIDKRRRPLGYSLDVIAYNPIPYSQSLENASCSVKLNIIDKNDNRPTFTNSYDFTVNETAFAGSFIGRVSATDNDRDPENKKVQYSMDNSTDIFRIDRQSGEIFLNKDVDYDTENQHSYTFQVYATEPDEHGNETVNPNGTTTVTITVKPENDNPPKFIQDITICKVLENQAGNFSCSVMARDADVGDIITYKIESDSKNFIVDANGMLFCKKIFDYETSKDHTILLNISATDTVFTAYTTVVIELIDIDDEVPSFSKNNYNFELLENNLKDQLIGIFLINDADSQSINLTLDNDSEFQISSSGELQAKNPFDRESKDLYTLLVTASDGVNRRNVIATVKILDRNDNPPNFIKTSDNIDIQENGPETTQSFIASDTDIGDNGNVTYSLLIEDIWQDNITIDNSGNLTIKSLDREALESDTLDFTIMAVDHGTPCLTGTLSVKVTLGDENDNPPVFTQCFDKQPLYLTEGEVYTDFLQLQASDKDAGANGIVKFNLLNLPHKLESAITVFDNGSVNFDLTHVDIDIPITTEVEWNISIEAYNPTEYSNGIQNATCMIKLHIVDKNDNLPHFNKTNYSFQFNETAESGTFIGRVSATDKDRSPEYRIVQYTMDNSTDIFRVDKLTGEIFLNKQVDYDSQAQHTYKLKVIATDIDHNFTGNGFDTAVVNIEVKPENDNPPQFLQDPIQCSIPENYAGPLNCSVMATDKDKDKINYIIQPARLNFRMDDKGMLHSDTAYDYEAGPDKLILNVTADDGIHYTSATVVIELLNINDEWPQFSRDVYVFQLYENNLVNQLVGTIYVTDLDSPNITLTINNTKDFSITPDGELHAKQPFNRELHSFYSLNVTASDGLNVNHTTVHMTILDINDNVPSFNGTVKRDLFIAENTIQTFGPFKAYDPDEGNNGNVSYSLMIYEMWQDNMTIDDSGNLTIKFLDREALESDILDLTIMAVDNGTPSLTGTLNVKVTVGDENDNPPVFTHCFDDHDIYLNEGGRYTNFSCKASDADKGNNNDTKYWIGADTGFPGTVMMGPKGGKILFNLKDVDADKGANIWNITITAYNQYNAAGIQNATRSVQLHVLDVNDNSPKFGTDTYSISFNESTRPGTSIGSVLATDKDRSTEYNTVEYFMESSPWFRVDRITGVIYLVMEIDYDTQNHSYKFQMNATDGYNNDTADVSITVTGVNDIAPQFIQDFTLCELQENHTGNFNCHVEALDLDVNDPSTLNYNLETADLDFGIDKNGNLICNTKYDFEDSSLNHTFYLNVSATDGRYTAFSTVAVELFNINDEAPVFSKPNYTFYMDENNHEGIIVGSILVTDADTENISLLILKLTDFTMTSEGNLLASREFDAEKDTEIKLTVTANDGVHTASATITVFIQDLNDNTPEFDSSVLNAVYSIIESQHVGDVIVKITAVDDDRDIINNQVEYQMLDGNLNDTFILNITSGEMTIHSFLNASLVQQYNLIIQAIDSGNPSLSNITTITIDIIDENNIPPFFLYEPYIGSVTENTNNTILRMHAVDPDLDANLTFTVLEDKTGLCNLSFSGDVLYANYIDVEATGNGRITCGINVTDGLHDVTTSVVIHIIDVNDNSPVFDNSANYTVEIEDTLSVGSHIMTISATDSDLSTRNESLLYFLHEESMSISYFGIDYLTGEITALQSLGPISGSTVNVSVTVRDAGLPPQNTTRNVSIHVKEVNIHPPDFNTTQIVIQVKENSQDFSELIQASDVDGEMISYRIIPGKDASLFNINETTGILVLSNDSIKFDYENRSVYNLIIEATDDARFPKTATVTVIIDVIDINEAPTVGVPNSLIYKKINTTEGDIITSVRINDPDSENVTFRDRNISITAVLNSTCLQKSFFSVNDKGLILVNNTLAMSGTFILTIHVVNLDLSVDSSPIIVVVSDVDGTTENINIHENNAVPYTLCSLHGNYNYRIASSTRWNFSIVQNGTYFDVVTNTVFDYDVMDSKTIDFSIEGVNNKTNILQKQIQIHITVINLNDNTPEFNSTHYEIHMYENQTVGKPVGMVTAIDRDGTLTKLTYSMDDMKRFSIDQQSGTISLAETWNFENSPVHSLEFNVTCNDTEFTNYTTVQIVLMDVNDNTPVFLRTSYNFRVFEDLSVGVKVPNMTAFASDLDTMDQGKLTYKIVSGEDGNYFDSDIDSSGNFSNFILAKSLDYEKIKVLQMDVMVLDTDQHNSTATVMVHVLDVNDNAPEFNKTSYIFKVQEGKVYNNSNFKISVYDLDSGENGQVDLTLVKPHPEGLQLLPDTGILSILSPLDREDTNVRHVNGTAIYEVTVQATDYGDPKLTSSVLVSIYVEDVNDCPPEFSQSNYSISIQEGVSIGQQVAMFTTSDCDYNPEFTQASFTLTGDGTESFRLANASEHTGVLYVAKELDWHVKEYYTLIITASDGENTRSANLFITVLDTNDNAPHFNKTGYTFNIAENQNASVTVGAVSATDEDVGLNGNVTYSITSGNINNTFQISTDFSDGSGKIQTTTSLDRETQSIYVMIVTAEDMAKRDSRQGTCTVTVLVDDINDNSPVFNTKYGYTVTVLENSAIDTNIQVVPSIAANDLDFGSNGTAGIRFSIQSQTNDSQYFSINHTTGEVLVAAEIDREKKKEFNLKILAEDSNGGPRSRNSTVDLSITVMDENDSPPVFINGPYMFNVPENSLSSTSVGRVTVTDADVNGTEHVRFRIIHGDDEKFYIETEKASGIIHVMGSIDRETKDMYNLTVTANDGVNESNTTVTVNILDMNDEAPVFVETKLTVEVTENTPADTFVCTVTATDGDQVNSDNSKVTYSLRNSSNFKISEDGKIKLLKKFDREIKSTYKIEVIAVDSGIPKLNATMIITVLISDVNDNSPQFLNENGLYISQKEVNIVEKCPVDTVVALIVAQDKDIGQNGEIIFSIEPKYAGYFRLDQIDETTGVVRVNQAIVINNLINSGIAEKKENASDTVVLDVVINARDNATVAERRNSSMVLRVVVEPINDAMPVFLKPDEPLKIWENITVGTMVGQCQAVVKNASYTHLTYSLLDNRTKAEFSLDAGSCNITTKVKMDRERTDVYNFPVMVKDGRTPERTAYTQIEIIVMDINDNSPKFYQPIIKLDIEENTDYLQPINVSAVDDDIGQNAVINYTLLDDYDGTFWIQQDTGILNISKQLDYEKHKNFTLNVLAADHGDSILSSTATVYITVLDVNDNAPVFYNVNHTISVSENFVGKICDIHATDSDSGLNGEVVYSLKSSSDVFTIDPFHGSLFVRMGLDYETASRYYLEITATDHGSPPQSTSINITVDVEDVYDFVPTFDKDMYNCSVSRTANVRDVIIDMNVTYGNGNVTFRMKGPGSDFFNINKDNGEIYVAQTLDAQRSDYILTVTAEDRSQTQTATATVLVNVVDLLLVFPQKEYHVNVAENINEQHVLVDLNTTEEINEHDVMYKIVRTEPNVTGLFEVDGVGRISCLKPLDREHVSQYVLYITAEPKHTRSKRDISNINKLDYSTLARLVIQVTDENDNPPKFPVTQKQLFGVPRDARAGYYVTHSLQAVDLDTEGTIEYKAIGGAMDMFDVQKDNGGVIVLRAIASAPKTTEFNFTVLAYDPTDSTKNDSITIQIHVIENDNRLKLVTSLPIEEFRRNEEGLIRNMSSILGVDIQTEKIETHKELMNGSISVFLDRSDFYFHAINRTTGLPVSSTELKRLIDASERFLNSLFHDFAVSEVITVVKHDSSRMGIPEIALICVAVLIFLGGLVGIVIALSALRSMEQMEVTEMKGKAPRLDDFELGTIRSQSSRASSMRPIAAVNPAFAETEFNTSGTQSQTDDKQPSEQEHESQEVRFEFNDEPIDQNLPEAEIRERDIVHLLARNTTSKDSGVGNTSFSSHEILHSDSSGGSDGNSGTSSPEQNDSSSNNSNMNSEEEPKLGNGPIMTSSPKIVRFRDVQVIPDTATNNGSKQPKGGKMKDTKLGILKLTEAVGETETDDGIDPDNGSIGDDHTDGEIAVTGDSQVDRAGSVEIGVGVPDALVVEHEEITSL